MFHWFRSRLLSPPSRPQWDVFISYASEERTLIAEPLAARLRAGGFQVWLDQLQLHLGSRLSKQILGGLRQSRFGVVIFSDAYLRKQWTQRELAGLLRLTEDGQHTVLPILHQIPLAVIEARYPALADALFGSTEDGIEELAEAIVRVMELPEFASPSTVSPSARRRFAALLDQAPTTTDIVRFLQLSPHILSTRLGILPSDGVAFEQGDDQAGPSSKPFLEWSPRFVCADPAHPVDFTPDVFAGDVLLSLQSVDWKIVLFRSPSDPIIAAGRLSAPLEEAVAHLRAFDAQTERHQHMLQSERGDVRQYPVELPSPDAEEQGGEPEDVLSHPYTQMLLLGSSIEYVVVAGRRKHLSAEDRRVLRAINEENRPISIRTYDWLLAASPLSV